MNILNTILNLILPINCASCGKNGKSLCEECLASFPQAERETESWIFSMYDYRNSSVKKTLWSFKYKNRKQLANIFAQAMYLFILEELADINLLQNFYNPILIPIPLTKNRKRKRGFNQAEELTKKLMYLDNGKNFQLETKILIKAHETNHQAMITNREIRLKNLLNSFSVKNEKKLQNKNIILIDDITTTGATLKEAKRTLERYGTKKIIAFTIAH